MVHGPAFVTCVTIVLCGCSSVTSPPLDPQHEISPSAGVLEKKKISGPTHELALMNVVVVDSLDVDPGVNKLQGGGSQGGVGHFRTVTVAKIDECTEQVRSGFLEWMQTKKLVALQSIDFPGDVLICASSDQIDGVFELKYVIDQSNHYAEVSIWYYRKDDTKVEPSEMGSFITAEDVDVLQRNIENAIKCTKSR